MKQEADMEGWRHRARYAWFKLRSALVTEHQRKVAALRAKRQVDYEERLKSILEAPPTRLFGDETPAFDEEELGTTLLKAYHRHWVAKIARLKAIERERATPGTGTLSPSSATLSATATEEEEEVVDDEVSLGDDGPVKPDAWAVRHQKGHVPALQDAEEVAPIAGYTTTDPKALDALTCAIRSDADALDRYKRATVRWPLKGWRRKVCPTTPEAEWDQVAMQKILDSPAIASREQQRAEGRVLLDTREHQYSSLLPRSSPLLCASCFASLLHGMPNNNQQPQEPGPTFDELVHRTEQDGEASVFAMEASFFVRLEAREEDGEVYRLCGASGTHEPQSLRHLEAHTIKAATSDDRFPFFDAGTGGANLPNLRITVSIIHSLEVMASAGDFTVGRHGLLLHFLDAHHIRRHSCLLPDVVQKLGQFDLIYRELARKSGYRSPLPRKFFEDRTRCWLYRVEASDATMTFGEYAEQWGVQVAPPEKAKAEEGEGEAIGAGRTQEGWALKAKGLSGGGVMAIKH